MKKALFFFLAFTIMQACVNEKKKINNKENALTSSTWINAEDIPGKTPSRVMFHADGVYEESVRGSSEDQNVVLKGKWDWINDDEISIVYTEMIAGGLTNAIADDDKNMRILRISVLTDNTLKGIQRHAGDAEDSGFADVIAYHAQP